MGSCDEPGLLELDEALARLAAAIPMPRWEAVRADRDDPALDRSAMDGAALRAGDGLAPRELIGTLFAGDDPARFRVGPGQAVRIMTGACVPQGADAVVPVEQLREASGRLVPTIQPRAGDHIRRRASQGRGGDELLPAGLPLNAARRALRAQVGLPAPRLRRVRVGIASTGDELVREPLPHQIRDSNGPMLEALAHALGAEALRLPSLPDDAEALKARLRSLDGIEVLLTSGGVSMGERDLLPGVLEELGATLLFHKIRLKPGKPMLAALLGGTVVLGLPGNPVSAYLNARLFLPMALARIQGLEPPELWRRGELLEAIPNKGNRPLLHPCRLDGEGLRPLDSRGSGDLVRLAQAGACAWIPEGGAAPGPLKYLDLP